MSTWKLTGAGTAWGKHQSLDLGILELHVLYRRWKPRGYFWEGRPGFYAHGRHDDQYGNFRWPAATRDAAIEWAYERLKSALCTLLRAMPMDDRRRCVKDVRVALTFYALEE